jgi:hypothetical protein
MNPRRRDARRYFLAWVLAIEPQNCRAATNGAPGPLVLERRRRRAMNERGLDVAL